MRWQFWQDPAPGTLPLDVTQALASQFRLEPQASAQLRILKHSGKFAGRPVQFIRIFDPGLVAGGAAGTVKFSQLEEGGELRGAVLFGGHIEKTGQVYLSDQRRKASAVQNG